jgi:nitrate reductase gamma subunit
VLAGSVGLLALTATVAVSVRHAVVDRVAGDDATGIVAGIAGIVLIGCALLAARRAWRPRTADRSRARRYARRVLLSAGLTCGALFVLVPAGLSLLATHKARSPVEAADLGHPYEHVTFRTGDGLSLHG